MLAEKTYPLQRSPLFRLRTKRTLAGLLGASMRDLRFLRADDNYEVFPKTVGGKERIIEHPTNQLEQAHQNLQRLLQRIETPRYLFSGKRHVSSIDNAKTHVGRIYSLTVDIKQFFPSCRSEYIYRFFCCQMKMSPDVALLLADIVTYNGHVPTGSTLSMSISFWAYSKTFEACYELAQKHKMQFTLYVDDMTFSSNQPIPRDFHASINYLLRRVGLQLKPTKIRYHSVNHYKVVTGAAISPNAGLRVPNKIRLKILNKLRACGNLKTTDEKNLRSLHGSLLAARRIEPGFLESSYRSVKSAILSRK